MRGETLRHLDIAPDRPLFRTAGHLQDFGFIFDQERRIFRDQDPANIEASELMGALDDAGYPGHKGLEHLFGLYEKLTVPVLAAAAKTRRRRKR
jgi:hypothetical protein